MLPNQLANVLKFLNSISNPTPQQIQLLRELNTMSKALDALESNPSVKIVLEELTINSAWGAPPDRCPTCGK